MPKTVEIPPTLVPGRHARSGAPITVFSSDYAAGEILQAHRHARGQLIYASHGIMTVTIESSATCLGGAWVVPPSQALWMPPGRLHAIRMGGKVAMRTLYLRDDVASFMPDTPQVLAVSQLLRELILRITALSSRADRRGHMTALILEELAAAPNLELRLPMPRDARLLRLCRAVLEHPGDVRRLPKLARIAGASTRSLSRLFQSELGMSFTAWRRQAQLLEALRRLAEGAPVTTVALDLGYSAPSAFTYMFRRALGVVPSRFFPKT
jgi:AraC-like DNA-binding protein